MQVFYTLAASGTLGETLTLPPEWSPLSFRLQLKRFAADKDLSDTQEIKQAVERTHVNIKWVSEHKEVVLQWFRREAGS